MAKITDEKREAALRENLRRRKQQAQGANVREQDLSPSPQEDIERDPGGV